jgi:hypothetical protein
MRFSNRVLRLILYVRKGMLHRLYSCDELVLTHYYMSVCGFTAHSTASVIGVSVYRGFLLHVDVRIVLEYRTMHGH